MGDVQDSQGVSASEVTYIVSGWSYLNYSLTHTLKLVKGAGYTASHLADVGCMIG